MPSVVGLMPLTIFVFMACTVEKTYNCQVGRVSSSTKSFSLSKRSQSFSSHTDKVYHFPPFSCSCRPLLCGGTPYARSISATCPAIWMQISSGSSPLFCGTDGQCTDLARAAIRVALHDAGTSSLRSPKGCFILLISVVKGAYSSILPSYAPACGGADGSLLLSPNEIQRTENIPLQAYHD